MHKLLERQLKRCFGSVEAAPKPLHGLLELVDEAYRQQDADLALLEHSMETVSQELVDRYRRLREEEARFRSLVQNSSDVITVVDAGGRIQYQSPSSQRVFGYEPDHLVGRHLTDLVHPADWGSVRTFLLETAQAREFTPAAEWRLRHVAGHWLHVETVGTNLLNDDTIQGMVLNARDVSERKALETQLEHQAFHDPLTGLANRALFRDRVEHALSRVLRHEQPLAVLFLDLDDFKTVNDSLGHAEGDRLLIAAAHRLQHCVRQSDTVARLGGDEFAILVEDDTVAESAISVAERITSAMRKPFRLLDREVFVGTSIGIAENRGPTTADDLLRDADVAMYMAKAHGKGGFKLFEPAMHTAVVARMELDGDLRRALEREEFLLQYQPIVSLRTGRATSVEALVRWRHPERGVLLPDDFIALAEETGLIVPLGDWVLRRACRDARTWHDDAPDGEPPMLSVNLSARQLQERDIADRVLAALEETGLRPDALVLEITESATVLNPQNTQARLRELKALGVRLAIDDFGTGYSSLSYLQHFPVDILKIDKSFVDGVASLDGYSAFAEMILALGETLRLRTVAEGIETDEQMQRLQELGCELGQGFHFARPLDPGDIATRLRDGYAPAHGEALAIDP